MKMSELTVIALQYDALLCRYARFIIKNKPAADKIVIAVFEDYYDSSVALQDNILRLWLKSRVQRKCMEWLHIKAVFYSPELKQHNN